MSAPLSLPSSPLTPLVSTSTNSSAATPTTVTTTPPLPNATLPPPLNTPAFASFNGTQHNDPGWLRKQFDVLSGAVKEMTKKNPDVIFHPVATLVFTPDSTVPTPPSTPSALPPRSKPPMATKKMFEQLDGLNTKVTQCAGAVKTVEAKAVAGNPPSVELGQSQSKLYEAMRERNGMHKDCCERLKSEITNEEKYMQVFEKKYNEAKAETDIGKKESLVKEVIKELCKGSDSVDLKGLDSASGADLDAIVNGARSVKTKELDEKKEKLKAMAKEGEEFHKDYSAGFHEELKSNTEAVEKQKTIWRSGYSDENKRLLDGLVKERDELCQSHCKYMSKAPLSAEQWNEEVKTLKGIVGYFLPTSVNEALKKARVPHLFDWEKSLSDKIDAMPSAFTESDVDAYERSVRLANNALADLRRELLENYSQMPFEMKVAIDKANQYRIAKYTALLETDKKATDAATGKLSDRLREYYQKALGLEVNFERALDYKEQELMNKKVDEVRGIQKTMGIKPIEVKKPGTKTQRFLACIARHSMVASVKGLSFAVGAIASAVVVASYVACGVLAITESILRAITGTLIAVLILYPLKKLATLLSSKKNEDVFENKLEVVEKYMLNNVMESLFKGEYIHGVKNEYQLGLILDQVIKPVFQLGVLIDKGAQRVANAANNLLIWETGLQDPEEEYLKNVQEGINRSALYGYAFVRGVALLGLIKIKQKENTEGDVLGRKDFDLRL
jgi:hypothetical protein